MKFLARAFLVLLVGGIVLSATWSQSGRDQFSAKVAHGVCSRHPQPEACTGKPWDPLMSMMGFPVGGPDGPSAPWWSGSPPSNDAKGGAALAAQVGHNAGWRGATLIEAVTYAGIESTWGWDAVSSTGCEGGWQICPPRPGDFDPQANAMYAYEKWAACHGGSFECDWTPYDQGHANPAWNIDYTIAVQAVSALPGGGA